MAGNIINKVHDLPLHDILGWDVLNWSELISYWQPVLHNLPKNSKVLAIGERNGGMSLWLALMGFHVTCSDILDISAEAGALHKKYGVQDRITYLQLDVVNEENYTGEFDIIIAKSVIGGLKAQRGKSRSRSFEVHRKAVENIHRMLAPGGRFFSAENLDGGRFVRWLRQRSGRVKGWRYLQYDELRQLFSSYSHTQTKTFGILPTLFSGRSMNKAMHIINKYLLSALPSREKYIAFTIAVK